MVTRQGLQTVAAPVPEVWWVDIDCGNLRGGGGMCTRRLMVVAVHPDHPDEVFGRFGVPSTQSMTAPPRVQVPAAISDRPFTPSAVAAPWTASSFTTTEIRCHPKRCGFVDQVRDDSLARLAIESLRTGSPAYLARRSGTWMARAAQQTMKPLA